MNFETYITHFTDHLTRRNYSPDTINCYTLLLKKFGTFLKENYPRITEITHITETIINDYTDFLQVHKNAKGRAYSNGHVRKILITIRSFFRYLVKHDYILKDPSLKIDLPREEKPLPRNILSEDEVGKILDFFDIRKPGDLKNKTMLELLYCCGMRTSELIKLKVKDIDFKEMTVFIERGKGGKSRVLPLGQHASLYLDMYLKNARKFFLKGKKDEGWLFLNAHGNMFDRSNINKSLFERVKKRLRIKKNITVYTMRHSIATALLKRKLDIRYIAEILGHSSLRSTQRYTHVEISDLQKVHSLFHPREVSCGLSGSNSEGKENT